MPYESTNKRAEVLCDTQSVKISESGVKDLRKSKEQIRKTPSLV